MLTKTYSRRRLGLGAAAFTITGALTACAKSGIDAQAATAETIMSETDWTNLSEADWNQRLTAMEFNVLRKEGTERPGSSPLNDEKRKGTFVCAGCGLALFTSEQKYDSGTGWPSFYDVIEGAVGTKTDRKLFVSRTEYHCARCGGHQGHVFKDGPAPTGLRYCNNGVALDFVEDT